VAIKINEKSKKMGRLEGIFFMISPLLVVGSIYVGFANPQLFINRETNPFKNNKIWYEDKEHKITYKTNESEIDLSKIVTQHWEKAFGVDKEDEMFVLNDVSVQKDSKYRFGGGSKSFEASLRYRPLRKTFSDEYFLEEEVSKKIIITVDSHEGEFYKQYPLEIKAAD
jgi:hypothetical protein